MILECSAVCDEQDEDHKVVKRVRVTAWEENVVQVHLHQLLPGRTYTVTGELQFHRSSTIPSCLFNSYLVHDLTATVYVCKGLGTMFTWIPTCLMAMANWCPPLRAQLSCPSGVQVRAQLNICTDR